MALLHDKSSLIPFRPPLPCTERFHMKREPLPDKHPLLGPSFQVSLKQALQSECANL